MRTPEEIINETQKYLFEGIGLYDSHEHMLECIKICREELAVEIIKEVENMACDYATSDEQHGFFEFAEELKQNIINKF